ncbi:VOC family protein [Shimia marina]|uniref:Glyoxalase-like domain protein n=1 Tax=Shimia marina TaxID=321267 RepID=A0A0N7LRN5_9RHOB|nr:VOC family protein [Shimia marina]CUH51316.1 Glyoxalase-like domain protein [Shimia marina]SFD52247.1 Catechol 2,3-dioxygenase [Shimia marina]
MSGILNQITWVYTETLAPCVAFYRDVLGLPVVRDAGTAMIFETAPGARIGLCEVFGARVVQPAGSMITLVVADSEAVDAAYLRLKEAVAGGLSGPEEIARFGIYSFFCADPNGYQIEVQCFL